MDDSSERVVFSGSWYSSARADGHFGSTYRCANAVTGEPTAVAHYNPLIRNTGYYDIYVWYRHQTNHSQRAPWTITYKGESFTNEVNETENGKDWVLLAGGLHFTSGTNVVVTVSNNSGEKRDRVIVADAVRFVRKEPTPKDAGQ